MRRGLAILMGVAAFSVVSAAEKKARKPNSVPSVVVRTCDEQSPTSLEFFVDKKSYANESVRVFNVDTYGEPTCCSTHLIVYIPRKDEPMSSRCFHVASEAGGLGFSGVNLTKAKASYNARTGLTLDIPFAFYDPDTGGSNEKRFQLIINQATETVQVRN